MPLRYLRGICFGNGAKGGVTVNRVGADPVKINDTCIGVFGGIRFAGLATKMDRYCGRMSLGMPPRTFKRWLNTSLFKKIMRNSPGSILLYPYGTVGTLCGGSAPE